MKHQALIAAAAFAVAVTVSATSFAGSGKAQKSNISFMNTSSSSTLLINYPKYPSGIASITLGPGENSQSLAARYYKNGSGKSYKIRLSSGSGAVVCKYKMSNGNIRTTLSTTTKSPVMCQSNGGVSMTISDKPQ